MLICCKRNRNLNNTVSRLLCWMSKLSGYWKSHYLLFCWCIPSNQIKEKGQFVHKLMWLLNKLYVPVQYYILPYLVWNRTADTSLTVKECNNLKQTADTVWKRISAGMSSHKIPTLAKPCEERTEKSSDSTKHISTYGYLTTNE